MIAADLAHAETRAGSACSPIGCRGARTAGEAMAGGLPWEVLPSTS